MIPSGFGEISVVHSGAGVEGQALWSVGFDNNAGSTAAEVAELFSDALVAQGYLDLISSSAAIDFVRVKLGPDATGPSAEFADGQTGTVGGEAAPPSVAALVHKITPLGGRKGRGRLFIPCLAEASLGNAGLITVSWRSAAQTMFDTIGGAMALASLPLMLLHTDATSPTAIEAFSVDQRVATQRRRLRR